MKYVGERRGVYRDLVGKKSEKEPTGKTQAKDGMILLRWICRK
jgi:hypothetical protein